MKRSIFEMNEAEKRLHIEMVGTTLQMIEEGHNTQHIAERIRLQPYQVESNIDVMLYILYKRVGLWRFIKTIFVK